MASRSARALIDPIEDVVERVKCLQIKGIRERGR